MKLTTGTTIISNGQVIDGTGAPVIPQGTVVIKDGRIAYAGPAMGAPEVPADAERIEACCTQRFLPPQIISARSI